MTSEGCLHLEDGGGPAMAAVTWDREQPEGREGRRACYAWCLALESGEEAEQVHGSWGGEPEGDWAELWGCRGLGDRSVMGENCCAYLWPHDSISLLSGTLLSSW